MNRLEMLKALASKQPTDPFPRYGLAMELRTQGQLQAAVDGFGELMRDFPNYVPTYLMAAQACGADPAACVVIEDSATGARAGLAAGMRVLGYAEHGPETPTAQQLTALGVPLFHRMEDLPGLLGIGAL